ncbi:hypothetical protein ACJ41O_014323 [Fusarium nematophilum]
MNELQVKPRDALSFILGYHHTRARLGLCNAGMPVVYLRDGEESHQPPVSHRWIVDLPKVIDLSDHDTIDVFVEELEIPGFRFERRPLRLLSVLSQFRDLEATDPRDKIFAFLNLAEDGIGLVPDYRGEARDIFGEGLPSWVPDFSDRLGRMPLSQGGYDDRFRAGTDTDIDIEDMSPGVNCDNTLTVKAIKVDEVVVSTQLGEDAVVQALQLALHGPANYPLKPMAWRINGHGRHLRPSQAVTRVEAPWRTLTIDDLTELDNDHEILDSRINLGIGFSNWILTDLLEAGDLFAEWTGLDPDHWTRILIDKSFCTRMTLWLAMYDGRQVSYELEVPDIEGMVADQAAKMEQEAELPGDVGEDGSGHPLQIWFLPTARHIGESFRAPQVDEAQRDEDPLGGGYKRPSMHRLTPLERRKLRNFEKRMRNATEGRELFMTTSGLFGFGPECLGQDPSIKDEVWISMGARVPFILHHVEGSKYRVVGEAYVYRIMHGEDYDYYTDWDEYGRFGAKRVHLV